MRRSQTTGNGYLWASFDETRLSRVGGLDDVHPLVHALKVGARRAYLARIYVSTAVSTPQMATHVESLTAALRATGAAVSVVPVVALADNVAVHCAVHFAEPPQSLKDYD